MTHNNLYGDVLLSIDKSFFDNAFSLQFNLGASIMDDKNQLTGYEGYLAGIPNKFTYNNIISDNSQSFPTQENYHDQIQAVYATMQLGWRGMLYVDVSVRNDWASMLAFTPKQNIFLSLIHISLPPRWALTPPFHPYPPGNPLWAVLFCYAPIPSRISSH